MEPNANAHQHLQDEADDRCTAWRDFDKVSARFVKEGFREAFSAHHEDSSALQEAFDSGYSTSFVVARLFGKLRATLSITVSVYKEGRLSCSPDQLLRLEQLYAELLSHQDQFSRFVEDQGLMHQVDQKLSEGQLKSVKEMQQFWNDQVRQVVDLEAFGARLRGVLAQMNCPWGI